MRISILVIFIAFSWSASGQHFPLYSQYIFNGLAINPAYAGNHEALAVTLSHRTQWSGIEGAPSTTMGAVHSILRNEKIGLGLLVYEDKFGITRNNGINGNYAYRINTGKFKVALGIQFGMFSRSEDWSEVTMNQGNDLSIPASTNEMRPTLGSGLFINSARFFIGLSAPQLLSYQSSFTNEKHYFRSYLFTTGYKFKLSEDFDLKPSILLKYIKNSPFQADLNGMVVYRNFLTAGVSYRSKDAVVFILRSNITQQINFGYSYDYTVGKLGNYTKGTHELLLSWILARQIKAKGARSF